MDTTPTEMDILHHLQRHGDNVPANIAEDIDRHAKYVTTKMRDLEERGLVENKGRGVYALSPDGRELARSESLSRD
jgi:Mn-dependent DtxR family transcriptional regulator